MIIVKDWEPLTIITKGSILDVAAVLDPPRACVRREIPSFPINTTYSKIE